MRRDRLTLYAICLLCFVANSLLWLEMKPMRVRWANVPPPPTEKTASFGVLGDQQFAYRTGGMMLQNFGNIGGLSTRLDHYDYDKLGQWFMLEDKLDPHSSFVPYLAAYYYGGTQNGKQLRPVIDYLAMVGRRGDDDHQIIKNWRWLAQATYLARFRLQDLNLALNLANELAALNRPDMPSWTKQMAAFVLEAQGDKKAAYAMMLSILKDSANHLQQPEINSMLRVICTRLLSPQEAAANQLCLSNPQALK